MSSKLDTLCEMGFPRHQAEKALIKTQYKGVAEAAEWLFNHANDADIDVPMEVGEGHSLNEAEQNTEGGGAGADAASNDGANEEVAKSMKCEDCGKLLRNPDEMQLHAARTQHSNFSESTEEVKPLTEEEKERQLEMLKEKMKARKAAKEEEEKKEKIQKEKIRRATGKEMVAAKERIQEMEMKKQVEARRREKEADRIAKEKVRQQIQKDKEARKQKQAAAKGDAIPPAVAPVKPPTAVVAPVEKKDYQKCSLKFRLPNGTALSQDFGVKEPLSAVKLYVNMNRTDGEGDFVMKSSYPPKVFSEEDLEKPLDSLGLVPSAVLVITKC